ncbi:hypothetical protein M0804_013675 [Polistes exclamans]|nr:hypothetical protein M0804_013675 [Polistes exclamans]
MRTTVFPRCFTDSERVCGIFTRYGKCATYAARSKHPSKCELLQRAEPEERKRIVVTANLCLNCFQANYKLAHVLRKAAAEKCKGSHFFCNGRDRGNGTLPIVQQRRYCVITTSREASIVPVPIFEELIEKTYGEAMGTLVDEIHNHVESVIDAKTEAELIINRAELVATQDTNSPFRSLSFSVRATVSSPSVDSIYRIPAVQLPHFDGQHEKSLSIADTFQSVIEDNPPLQNIQKKCKSRHHEFLHVNEAVTECATTGITSCCVRTASAVQNAHVELHHSQTPSLLLTAVMHLLDRNNRPHECCVLLDSGSKAHFLTICFANLLRIAKQDVNVPISGVNQTETRVKQAILATLKSRTKNYAEIRFARNVAGDGEELEMHCFCDASEKAYNACIYVKILGKNPTLRLVCAKSKVLPLKTQSLSRLEVFGALILSRLFIATKNALRRNDFLPYNILG